MRSPVILAFDCSAASCAAALLAGTRVILRDEAMQTGQSDRLIPMLEEMLAEAGLSWSGIDLLGVGTGPGNFTGVRIAVAAARGLALGLGIPAIGVTRLEALAHGAPRPVTVAEDARRGAIYLQHFDETAPGPAQVLALADCPALIGPVIGSAAPLLGLAGLAPAHPLALSIARIAEARASGAQAGEAHPRPSPFYLRGADAAPPADPPPVILADPIGADPMGADPMGADPMGAATRP